MTQTFRLKIVMRLVVLSIMMFCFVLILRNEGSARFVRTQGQEYTFKQRESPTVTTQNSADSPLIISTLRSISADQQAGEITFNLTNVSRKSITVYVIKREIDADGTKQTRTYLVNLELSNRELTPNYSASESFAYDAISDKQHHINLRIEYVEFNDGSTWGADSGKFAETTSGQRAGALAITQKLGKTQHVDTTDVVNVINSVAASVEPPADASEAWKEGFRSGGKAFADRLKRAQVKGGWAQVDAELHQYTRRLKGAN